MLEFENIKELKANIDETKRKKVEPLSVFQYYARMIMFLILYAVIISGTTIFMYGFLIKSAKIVRVPGVVNKKFVDGYLELKKVNLDINVIMQNYDSVPYGVITAQTIPPNALVKERRKIVLTVSQGMERGTVISTNGQAEGLRSYYLVYQLPAGIRKTLNLQDTSEDLIVKIYVTDEGSYANSLVFNGAVKPGDSVRVPLKITGKLRKKIFVDDNLVLEQETE
jgi:hypothetical protein